MTAQGRFRFVQKIRIPDNLNPDIKIHPFDNNLFVDCCHRLLSKLNARENNAESAIEFFDRKKNIVLVSSDCEAAAGKAGLMILWLGRLSSEGKLEESSPDNVIAESEKFAAAYAGTEGMFSEYSASVLKYQTKPAYQLIGEFSVIACDTRTEYKMPIHFRLEHDDPGTLFQQKRSLCQLKSFLKEFGIAAKSPDTNYNEDDTSVSRLTLELQAQQEERLALGWLISRWAAAQINNELEVTRQKLYARLPEKIAEVSEAYGRPFLLNAVCRRLKKFHISAAKYAILSYKNWSRLSPHLLNLKTLPSSRCYSANIIRI